MGRINWNTHTGKKVDAYILKAREQGFTYREIADQVNKRFTLTRKIDGEVARSRFRRSPVINKQTNKVNLDIKTNQLSEEIEEMHKQLDQEELERQQKEAEEKAIKEAKEKARKDQEKRLLAKLLKERGTTELIVETFEETIKAFEWKDIQPPKPVGKRKAPKEEALLLFSDAQIGEHITREDTNGFGEYNVEIFKERMDKLVNKMRELTEVHKGYSNIETLNIFMLGDNVDGIGIYRGQEHHLDALVVEQLLIGSEKIAEAIIQLLGTFQNIKITGIIGNHGRMGRKGENPSHVNFDFLLYKMLERMLSEYGDRIEWTIPTSNWVLQDILGNGFLLLHGDTIRAWNGIPYYGIDRADARLTKMLQARNRTYKYLCLGHHHNPGDVDSPNGEKILNGTMVGGSNFSINQLHTTSRPSQWFFGINKEEGITWRYKILLDL